MFKKHFLYFILLFWTVSTHLYALDNVALHAHAWASSEGLPAANAVDGNPNTRWGSIMGIDPSWIAIDLGQTYQISNVTIDWEAANAEIYELQGSNDATQWTTIVRKTDGVFGNRTDSLDVFVNYRYIRVYGTKRSAGNKWGYSIWELKVYGTTTAAAQLPVVSADASTELQPAANAIDNNPNTRWESQHGVDPSWLRADLGKTYNLSRVVIDWEAANAAVYQIQGSKDNTNWTTLATKTDGVFGNRTDTVDVSGPYRYVRIYGTKRSTGNQWGYSIWNLRIFGSEVTDNPPEPQDYVPLYNENTVLDPETTINTPTSLITRFVDRARDRHAREDEFKAYDHYLSFYWIHRTAQIEIIDEVAKGGNKITFNVKTEWPLGAPEFRAFYRGINTVAEYWHNVLMTRNPTDPLRYSTVVTTNPKYRRPLQKGDRVEIEVSQFLDNPPEGRANYYGTVYLYIVGQGIAPWMPVGVFGDPSTEREDSYPLPVSALLGGNTTIHQQTSNEPTHLFKQMATNTAPKNGQVFMMGRRVHHTNTLTGAHIEQPNPTFPELANKTKGNYINNSCVSCHQNNGRGLPPATGTVLNNYTVKVGDQNGNIHPKLGRVLQPRSTSGTPEATVLIQNWIEAQGLRQPNFQFTGITPEKFSARIAPQIVGMGLLEAIPESAIAEQAALSTSQGLGGKMNIVTDMVTGEPRVGRFGWKAGKATVKQQLAEAFNVDMAVMTSIRPTPECGSQQTNCGETGEQLTDQYLDALTHYISLLGVRAQRNSQDPKVKQGEQVFKEAGCSGCHTPTYTTSAFHPRTELRNQIIHPYTDMLLHNMGPGLASTLSEGNASGAEWRTAPLWNIGLTAGVSGGEAYLHDGRARSLNEAILWHDGDAAASRAAYQKLSNDLRDALLQFLKSL
ncbi:Predicted thiol oxidoreductase [Legionella wadsworthii]|uniref:Predicted thiol oxidoreductase n=1 Tax=Legionella wadsworthii TaxID=28088 RepID=A0A378LR78_9GAMM|nr:di-heme oxidoredictase family protein [Legionella wadsworthii]STY28342.1 Predicted thiol oxidoreductase [Legionella wadsworthii]